jgi:hypothetical protein
MIRTFAGAALLLGALALTLTARAQQSDSPSADFAVTYNFERAKPVFVDCGCFWLQGGSLDVAVPVFHGLGVAATLTGEHKANITPGVDLSKIAFMAGPRYTFDIHRRAGHFLGEHGVSIFGEGLIGSAHGFDAPFPTASGTFGSANALSLQFGGGLNIALSRGFGVRAFELDYVRTRFRDLADNSQSDLRLAFGVTYHLGQR